MTVVEALAPTVAVLKPQSGVLRVVRSAGIAVLERVLARTREAGAAGLAGRQTWRHRFHDGRIRGGLP